MRNRTRDLALIGLFAAVIALCSWITIPAAVPFTMQTFAVFASVGLLGGRRGTLAVAVYILLGAVGLPVFAGFGGGFGVIFSSIGGYIVGFLFTALTMWAVTSRFGRGSWALAASMLLGLIVCYAFGTAWFMLAYARAGDPIALGTALGMCVLPFILPDAVKIALALSLCARLQKLNIQR